jgi:hypothetical protein
MRGTMLLHDSGMNSSFQPNLFSALGSSILWYDQFRFAPSWNPLQRALRIRKILTATTCSCPQMIAHAKLQAVFARAATCRHIFLDTMLAAFHSLCGIPHVEIIVVYPRSEIFRAGFCHNPSDIGSNLRLSQ